MEINDLKDLCNFDDLLEEGDEIQCPKCEQFSSHRDWEETEIYCEDCGTHIAIKCPKCDERFDTVFSKVFHIRETEETKRLLIEEMRKEGFTEEEIRKVME